MMKLLAFDELLLIIYIAFYLASSPLKYCGDMPDGKHSFAACYSTIVGIEDT